MIIALKSCIVPNFFYDTEEAGERRDLPPLSLKFFFLGLPPTKSNYEQMKLILDGLLCF